MRPPVFIVGCPRSGTSFLYHLLLSGGGFASFHTQMNVFDVLEPIYGDLSVTKNKKAMLREWLRSRAFEISGLSANEIEAKVMAECNNGSDFIRTVMNDVAGYSGEGEQQSERSDADLVIVEQVFGIVKRDYPKRSGGWFNSSVIWCLETVATRFRGRVREGTFGKTSDVRAVSGCHHPCKGHRNEERERALSYPYGKPGLEQSNNRIIFVPDSKTVDGRRMIPMSNRAYEVLRVRAAGKAEGWLFPSARSRCGHLTDLGKQFRIARRKAQLSEDLVLYCARHDYGTRVLSNTGNLAADEDHGA